MWSSTERFFVRGLKGGIGLAKKNTVYAFEEGKIVWQVGNAMSELVLVDRSFYHQGREYKSPYDWCQREYHQGKAGGRSSFRRRVSRRIVGNGENHLTFGVQTAEPERCQHGTCPIGKKIERKMNVGVFGEKKRLRDLTASERIGKKKDLEISRGSISWPSREARTIRCGALRPIINALLTYSSLDSQPRQLLFNEASAYVDINLVASPP